MAVSRPVEKVKCIAASALWPSQSCASCWRLVGAGWRSHIAQLNDIKENHMHADRLLEISLQMVAPKDEAKAALA